MADELAREQAMENRRRNPSPRNGQVLPPGFEAHPERRHHGAWKKEDTPRYKLERMMTMTEDELRAVFEDRNAPLFERKIAMAIRNSDWKVIEAMTIQVYGFPAQEIRQTNVELRPILPKPVAIPAEVKKPKKISSGKAKDKDKPKAKAKPKKAK